MLRRISYIEFRKRQRAARLLNLVPHDIGHAAFVDVCNAQEEIASLLVELIFPAAYPGLVGGVGGCESFVDVGGLGLIDDAARVRGNYVEDSVFGNGSGY